MGLCDWCGSLSRVRNAGTNHGKDESDDKRRTAFHVSHCDTANYRPLEPGFPHRTAPIMATRTSKSTSHTSDARRVAQCLVRPAILAASSPAILFVGPLSA